MALGTVTLLVEAVNQMGYLFGAMPESSLFVLLVVGGVVWLIIQVPIILFSYRAYRRT